MPLLVDMYGEGCLRNLTALAQMSDEMNALVHQNIYEPFLRYSAQQSVAYSCHEVRFAERSSVIPEDYE